MMLTSPPGERPLQPLPERQPVENACWMPCCLRCRETRASLRPNTDVEGGRAVCRGRPMPWRRLQVFRGALNHSPSPIRGHIVPSAYLGGHTCGPFSRVRPSSEIRLRVGSPGSLSGPALMPHDTAQLKPEFKCSATVRGRVQMIDGQSPDSPFGNLPR